MAAGDGRPEDDRPHPVDEVDWVPICAVCMRTVSTVGAPPNQRWTHDEPQYDSQEQPTEGDRA